MFRAGDEIILTTHDGYRWLRYAADYKAGEYRNGADELSGMPENAMKPPKASPAEYTAGICRQYADGRVITDCYSVGVVYISAGDGLLDLRIPLRRAGGRTCREFSTRLSGAYVSISDRYGYAESLFSFLSVYYF